MSNWHELSQSQIDTLVAEAPQANNATIIGDCLEYECTSNSGKTTNISSFFLGDDNELTIYGAYRSTSSESFARKLKEALGL